MSDRVPLQVPGGRIPARWRRGALVVLALIFLAVGLHQAGRDAPTVDEGIDVSSGVSGLVRHDLRMSPEHPVLPKVVAALPTLLAHPIVPDTDAWRRGDWFDWSDDFISANADAGRLHSILLWARAVVLVETLACGALIYLLTKRFFGPDGGFVSAVAWLTTPYVVGLGHFAMIDIPFALATLALCLLLARWRDRPTMAGTAWVGVALAAALASRHTSLVLAVFALAIVFERLRADRREVLRHGGLLVLVSVVGLWVVYRGLAPTGSSGSVEASFGGLVAQAGDQSTVARLIGLLPLPQEWRAGFAYLDLTSTARPSSLLGQSWDGGAWWFFPVSAALKLPLTLVAALVAGWIVAARRALHRHDLVRLVVAPGLILWLFLVAQPLDLGLRLAMPVVALAFVGLGALVTLVPPPADSSRPDAGGRLTASLRRPAVGVLVAVLLIQVLAFGVAVPHSLAWTPPPWSPSYRWVSDSSLDAGQALYEVRAWAKSHDRPYVAIDTTRGLEVRGGSRSMMQRRPADLRGWVAVGVTPLMQTRRDDTVYPGAAGSAPPGFSLAWLRKYCPVATLGGGSVLVYRFTAAPDPTPGPERPARPCLQASHSTAA